jgi:phosphate-selective porin OprO and OprP
MILFRLATGLVLAGSASHRCASAVSGTATREAKGPRLSLCFRSGSLGRRIRPEGQSRSGSLAGRFVRHAVHETRERDSTGWHIERSRRGILTPEATFAAVLCVWLVGTSSPTLAQAARDLPAQVAGTEAPAPGGQAPPQPQVAAGPDGFAVQSANGDFRLQLGLLVHADARFALHDSNRQVVDTFVMRRLRPYMRGRFSRRFEFYVVPDFAGGTVVVQDAYVDTIFAPAFRIRAGKGKTPFGFERLHPASNLTFFERALPTTLVPNRDIGVQALGDISGGVVSYLAGIMNGVPDGGSGDVETSDSKDLSGRLIVRPFNKITASPLRGLGLAISGSRGRQTGPDALPTFKTVSLQQPYFSYVGAVADGVRTRYSPQVFYYRKGFGGWGEYVHTETPISKGAVWRQDIAHDAWQVAGSYVLTGEAATDAGAGVRPRANFDFGNGHFGAFQVAARYHVLKIDERAFTLGFAAPGSSRKAEAWTIGLNWYLTGNFRYTFNFERTVFDGDPDGRRKPEDAFVFRTQVFF